MVKPRLIWFRDVVEFEFNDKIYQGIVEDVEQLDLPWDDEGYDEYGIRVKGDDDLFFVTNKEIIKIVEKSKRDC